MSHCSAYDLNSDDDDENVLANNGSFDGRFRKKIGNYSRDTPVLLPSLTVSKPYLAPSSVGYVFSERLFLRCNGLVQITGRALLLHSLVQSYGLLKETRIIKPDLASYDELISFHDSSFINYLRDSNAADEDDDVDQSGEDFGLAYDCPPTKRTFDFVQLCVGASLAAARSLTQGRCGIAINWMGGWHHAHRDRASGFCYANDVVIAVHELSKTFNRILYIDLDLHHGDGVQEAFRHTNSVFTVSLHKFEAGFFPGTGGVDEEGIGKGLGHCVNVPLKNGIGDDKYVYTFCKIVGEVSKKFLPDAVVVQCGADCISGDPNLAFNLTPLGMRRCLESLRGFCPVPTLVLGGGGYNHVNTAKCWTLLTAAILEKEISEEVPAECSEFERFGPDFTLNVFPSFIKDENTEQYLNKIIGTILEKIKNVTLT